MQPNMTSLISQAEWWKKKTETNQVRGNFNMNLFLKVLKSKEKQLDDKNENK